MRTKKPLPKHHHGERKIHFPNCIWTYRVGSGRVKIRDPNGQAVIVDYATVTGWDHCSVERGIHKRYFAVKPSHIKSYIEKHLLNKAK